MTTETTTPATALVHPWEAKGLGRGPFTPVCIISVPTTAVCEANPETYNRLMGEATRAAAHFGVNLCSCYVCGMSLTNNVVVRDADRKHIVVGVDCAAKTKSQKLVKAVNKLDRDRLAAAREEKKAQEREERLAAERLANGGLTNSEKRAQEYAAEQARRAVEAEQVAAQARVENEWLLSRLRQAWQGDFVRSMTDRLERLPLAKALTEGMARACSEIYAKTFGRGGSKANAAALDEFWSKYEAAVEAAKPAA